MVEFSSRDIKQYEKALQAIEKLSNKKPSFDENSLTVTVPVKDGSKMIVEVVRALDSAKVEPVSLSMHRPSLDDVFLALTGKKTEAEEAPKSANQHKKKKGNA